MRQDTDITDLHAAYMIVFDTFAASRSDVASELGIAPAHATRLLSKLRDADLVVTYDVNSEAQGSHRRGAFAEVVWQCLQTYDSISREDALALFAKTFNVAPEQLHALEAQSSPTNTTTTTKENKMASTDTTKSTTTKDTSKKANAAKATSTQKNTPPADTTGSDTIDAFLANDAEVTGSDTPPAATTSAFEWPKPAAKLLAEYVKECNAPEFDADSELRPYVNENGRVFIHSEHWRGWLASKGLEPTKSEAAKPLRDAELVVRATPIPTRGYAKGFYTGNAPKGFGKLTPRQPRRRTGASKPRSPFGKLTAEQTEILGRALTMVEFDKDEAELAAVRDELLVALEV